MYLDFHCSIIHNSQDMEIASVSRQMDKEKAVYTYGCLRSCFSCVQLFAPHGLYSDRPLCPWDSPGKNIGKICHALLHWIFPTQEMNHVSYVSCIGRHVGFFTARTTWEGHIIYIYTYIKCNIIQP